MAIRILDDTGTRAYDGLPAELLELVLMYQCYDDAYQEVENAAAYDDLTAAGLF